MIVVVITTPRSMTIASNPAFVVTASGRPRLGAAGGFDFGFADDREQAEAGWDRR
jgi:hypothetical protein